MTCPTCHTSLLVEIAVDLGARQVTMRSCSACDRRWWDSEGDALELRGVLALASARR